MEVMKLKLKNIHKDFDSLCVLKNLEMEIEGQKVICILGPSGCGKTTLLNLISGIMKPDRGSISGLESKTISYLFQEPRLLPWKTAADNLDFVLKDKMSKEKRKETIARYLGMVGLAEYKAYYPAKMSGGMKQRLAIARAFAYPADILLMDEPFKSLDLQLKLALMNDFLNLWLQDRRTVFFVTHDVQEALLLGDEIYCLSEKPTRVRSRIENKVPPGQRNLQNKYILSLEKELYQLLMKAEPTEEERAYECI